MKKVLVIEDSRAVAQVLASQIEKETNRYCDIAATRQEAIDLLKKNASDYLVITCDLHLPDSNGLETIEVLEEFDLPVVVLTGDMNTALQEDILSYEFVTDYVVKSVPGSIEYVASYIKRLAKNVHTKVMVVDDSRVSRKIMAKILTSQLLTVIEADSGEKALELFKEHRDLKLVITDGELGKMNGVDLIHQLRKTHSAKELAIIGFSGAYSREILVRFLKAGANDFVSKPVLAEEMITRVNRHLGYLDSMNELIEITENQNAILKMAAHDIRDPISSISTMTEFLLGNIDGESSERHGLGLIKQTCDNLIKLVGGLTEYSRYDLSTLKSSSSLIFSMKNVVESKIAELQPLADKKGQSFVTDIEDAKVFGEEMLLGRVFANYLSNAMKYSPESSEITVTARVEGSEWVLKVTDQGPGVAENERHQLFTPFAKISNKPTSGEDSIGLGLAFCKRLIDAHDGSVGFLEADNGGSCFYVRLPITD